MKSLFKSGIICLFLFFVGQICQAGAFNPKWTLFEWGVFPPVQLFSEKTSVYGFRFSTLYTENKDVYGFDAGLGCVAENFGGLQAAGWSLNKNSMTGIAIAAINCTEGNIYGIQFGGFSQAGWGADTTVLKNPDIAQGAQISGVNLSLSKFSGCQIGVINLSNNIFNGLQLGLYNSDKRPNTALDINADPNKKPVKSTCIQIGLLNFKDDGVMPVTLFINF